MFFSDLFLTISCCLKQILVYEKSVLCWRGSLVSPGRDKEELEVNLLQSVLTNLPPIYSEEGRDLYLVTVFHFQVNLIFSCYLVILWGIAGLPSAMKRLRMISLWSVVAPYLTQKEEREKEYIDPRKAYDKRHRKRNKRSEKRLIDLRKS